MSRGASHGQKKGRTEGAGEALEPYGIHEGRERLTARDVVWDRGGAKNRNTLSISVANEGYGECMPCRQALRMLLEGGELTQPFIS